MVTSWWRLVAPYLVHAALHVHLCDEACDGGEDGGVDARAHHYHQHRIHGLELIDRPCVVSHDHHHRVVVGEYVLLKVGEVADRDALDGGVVKPAVRVLRDHVEHRSQPVYQHLRGARRARLRGTNRPTLLV